MFELLPIEDWNLSQNGCQLKMFPSNCYSSNFGSFTLTFSVGFEGEHVWFEVVSLTEECLELVASKTKQNQSLS